MKVKHIQLPFVKIPQKIDQTLYLIREELKAQKFFNGLHKIGIDDCYYQPRLGKVILTNVGIDDGSDEISEFYYKLIEKRSKKINEDNESVMTQAIKVYIDLMTEKRKRRAQSQ